MRKNKKILFIPVFILLFVQLMAVYTWGENYFFKNQYKYDTRGNATDEEMVEAIQARANDPRFEVGPFVTKLFEFKADTLRNRKKMKNLIMRFGGVSLGITTNWVDGRELEKKGLDLFRNHFVALIGWKNVVNSSEAGDEYYICTQGQRPGMGSYGVKCSSIESIPDEYNDDVLAFAYEISDTDPFEGYKLANGSMVIPADQDDIGGPREIFNNSNSRWEVVGGYWHIPNGNSSGSRVCNEYKDDVWYAYSGLDDNSNWNKFIYDRIKVGTCTINYEANQTLGYTYFDEPFIVDVGERASVDWFYSYYVRELDPTGSLAISEAGYTISANCAGLQMHVKTVGDTPVFSVEDPTVCSVSQSGYITPKAAGNTIITVSTENGKNKKTRPVFVEREVGEIVINDGYTIYDNFTGDTKKLARGYKVYSTEAGGKTDITSNMDFVFVDEYRAQGRTESAFDDKYYHVDEDYIHSPRFVNGDIIFRPKKEYRKYIVGATDRNINGPYWGPYYRKNNVALRTAKVPFEEYYEYVKTHPEMKNYTNTDERIDNDHDVYNIGGALNVEYTGRNTFPELRNGVPVRQTSDYGISMANNYSIFTYDGSCMDEANAGTLMITSPSQIDVGQNIDAVLTLTGNKYIADGSINVKINIVPKTNAIEYNPKNHEYFGEIEEGSVRVIYD